MDTTMPVAPGPGGDPPIAKEHEDHNDHNDNDHDNDMPPEARLALITSHLAEVLNPEILEEIVLRERRALRVYWGTATTGKPHCGYFVPLIKLAELLRAGCRVTILLADIHGYLDAQKAPWALVAHRARYYAAVIRAALGGALGVDVSRLRFVLGSEYQLTARYTLDRFRLEGVTRVAVAQKAGAEVVKQMADPTLGGLIYPLMQALDEEHLDVDAQFGGLDQRKIFTFALENLPRLGYRARAHLMNPMVPGLGEAVKMSASDADSKIDLLDPPALVERKLRKAKCVPRELDGNGVVAFVEHVIFRALALKAPDGKVEFRVPRAESAGADLVYSDIQQLKDDFAADVLTPQLLKSTLTTYLNALLAPIRADYESSAEWQETDLQAYPPEQAAVKVKKVKDKGDPAKRAAAAAARQQQQQQQQEKTSADTEHTSTSTPGVVAMPDGHVEGPEAEQVAIGETADAIKEKLQVDRLGGAIARCGQKGIDHVSTG